MTDLLSTIALIFDGRERHRVGGGVRLRCTMHVGVLEVSSGDRKRGGIIIRTLYYNDVLRRRKQYADHLRAIICIASCSDYNNLNNELDGSLLHNGKICASWKMDQYPKAF